MNKKFILVSLMLLLAVPLIAAPNAGSRGPKPVATALDNTSYIDANNIFMFVTNQCSFGRDLGGTFGYDYGTFFPYNGAQYILDGSQIASPLYASGLWIGGIDSATGERRTRVAIYNSEFWQGPWENAGTFVDDPAYHVYKLFADSLASNPNADYTNWILAARQGAPFVGDSATPKMIGDQMCWAVYHDRNDASKYNDASGTTALGVEIRQTTFAFRREGALNNIIFVKFQAYNRGGNTIQNCYFSLWADPDLGGSGDDLVGCDSTLGLGFIYNASNADADYGSRPPSLGYDFFQGPLVYTGDLADTGKAWDTLWPGYANLGMVSFNKYINGTDPEDPGQIYNYMQGLNADGSEYTYNGFPTKYFVSGDPVTNTGDIDFSPADRRFMQSTGPITFRPNDSVEILAAIIVGQGGDRFSSIQVMKYFDVTAQDAYDKDFKVLEPPVAPRVTVAELDGQISLRWTDTSETDAGDYPFQGYTVFQGPEVSGPWTQIANYDVIDGQSNISDLVLNPLTGILETRGVKIATDNGIRHYFGVTQDYLTGGDINNVTKYFFRVEAYSFDPTKSPKTATSATIVESVPQSPIAEVDVPHRYGDTIAVDHVTGPSDGVVTPFVIDPKALTGHDYRVTFFSYPDTVITPEAEVDTTNYYTYDTLTNICFITIEFDTLYCVDTILDSTLYDTLRPPFDTTVTDIAAWRLTDVTAGEVVLDSQTNQTGDDNYRIVDGMLLVVSGPFPGLKTGDPADFASCEPDNPNLGWCIPNGTRRFTWAGGANGLGFEAFQGALGYASPYSFFTGINTVAAPFLKNVLLKLAVVDATGVFSTADENVSYAYRYGRGFAGAPAKPEFIPYIVNPSGGYSYQDFTPSVPLSAWDIEANPPRRLAIGYLENNAINGTVDGKYWPPLNTAADNTAGDGPREWLFIANTDYSETPDPLFQTTASSNPHPYMYFATWARRANVGWSAGDEFVMYANHVNSELDTFNFTALAPVQYSSGEARLDKIKVVPNPYYLIGPYDPAPTNRNIYFQHLPAECTIYIYNIAGDLVRKIERNDASSSITAWDVMTDNNLPVASGIYVWVVDAPGFGQKIGKMAVFMEAEVIKKY